MLFSCLVTRVAAAEAPSTQPDPSVAITVSPVHLVIPMAEVTAEIRLARRVGVAVIAGIGAFQDPDTDQRISLYEAGVSARYYVTGSFRRGLQLGGEALYLHAATDDNSIEVRAVGLGLSPFAGYKWTHRTGLTLEGQLGATFVVARAKAATGEMAKSNEVGPMLNLQLGYSF